MKLQKEDNVYYLVDGKDTIATTDSEFHKDGTVMKLSKENCDEIFGVVDINKWANEKVDNRFNETDGYHKFVYVDGIVDGFNKAMELNKDKLFGVKEVVELCKILLSNPFEKCGKTYQELTDNYVQSLQQPTEIEVEIEMVCPHPSDTYKCGLEFGCDEDGCNNPNQIPYLDENGCLILKKK